MEQPFLTALDQVRAQAEVFSSDLLSLLLAKIQVDDQDDLQCPLSLPLINKTLSLSKKAFHLTTEFLKAHANITTNKVMPEPLALDPAISFSDDVPDTTQIRRLCWTLPFEKCLDDQSTLKETLIYLLLNEILSLNSLCTHEDFTLEIRNPQVEQQPFLLDPQGMKVLLTTQPEGELQRYCLLVHLRQALPLDNSCATEAFPSKEPTIQTTFKKYDRFQYEKTQVINISLQTIDKLIAKMDFDKDMMLSQADIEQFCKEHYLDIDSQVLVDMFRDAAKERPQVNRNPENIFKGPLTRVEIEQAVRLRSRRTTRGWEQVEKPFRKYWVLFFEILGLPIDTESKDKKPMIHPLTDMHSTYSQNEAKWKQKQRKPFQQTLPLKMPKIGKTSRPEAQLDFKSGKHVRRTNNDEVIYQNTAAPPQENSALFSKVVNNRLDSQNGPQVSFETQQYYKESLRLAADPSLYRDTNPITKFVPTQRYRKMQNNEEMPIQPKKAPRVSQIFEVSLGVTMDRSTSQQEKKKSYNLTPGLHHTITAQRELQREQTAILKARYSQVHPATAYPSFHASFNPEQCIALKKKLATSQCANMKPYSDPPKPCFREEVHQSDSRAPFKVHTRATNPEPFVYQREEFRSVPVTALPSKPTWNSYYSKADLHQEFISHKYPHYLDKGDYEEPIQQLNNLLRDPVQVQEAFELFHRPLKCEDRGKFFGENYSKLEASRQ